MKKILSFVSAIALFASVGTAQIGATAPDFTVTDIDGVSHNLYDYLNDGKVVVLDCSATWCGPCWGFHESHYLEDLYNDIGQGGTGEAVILFYEADPATDQAELEGAGSSQGDWTAGVSYPVMNENPVQLDGNIFWPTGYPTINVIAPGDKTIKEDLWNIQGGGLSAMKDEILSHVPADASMEENSISFVTMSAFPNPSNGNVQLNVASIKDVKATLEITNLMGQLVKTVSLNLINGTNSIELDLTSLEAGNYVAEMIDQDNNASHLKIQITK